MNRAGKFVNNMPGDTSYQSFCPNPLPPVPGLEFDEDMLQILVKASRSFCPIDSKRRAVCIYVCPQRGAHVLADGRNTMYLGRHP